MSSEIVRRQELTLSEQIQYANVVSQASIVPDAYKGKPADIVVALGFGQSVGLSPAESLYRINVIKGKPTMSAELIAAQVRKAGHRLRISKDERALSATATIVRCDDPDAPFSVTRDRAWAERMGLIGNANYQRQPMTMLTWRAITACAREACPEALYGVAYTPDEMRDSEAAPVPQGAPEAREEPSDAPVEVEATVQAPDALQPLRDRVRRLHALTGVSMQAIAGAIQQRHAAASMADLTEEEIAQECADLDREIASEQERQADAA